MSKLTATQWTNGIGWDIRTNRGIAEVRDMVRKVRCFAPVAPRVEYRERVKRNVEIDRVRVADFPLGTDPVECVRLTLASGKLVEDGEQVGAVPMLSVDAVLNFEAA